MTHFRTLSAVPMLLVVLLASVLAGCGDGPPSASPGPLQDRVVVVEMELSRYEPKVIEVAVGTTVRFVNLDPFAHTVTAADLDEWLLDSGDMTQGDEIEVTFDESGTYDYFCRIHPTMRGTVTVR